MAQSEPLNKVSVLSPVLANAALLIAAPSLGCINTYTKAFTDLCRVYGLQVPDLENILQYSVSPLSKFRSTKSNCFQKPFQVTSNISELIGQHLEIKKEPEDNGCDTVNFKEEIADKNTALYNASLYDTKPSIQGTTLDNHVKKEGAQSEVPIDNALEIPFKIKAKSKLFHTNPSTPGTSLEKHIPMDNVLETAFKRKAVFNVSQFESPIDNVLETPLKRKAKSNISCTKPYSQVTSFNKHLKNKVKPNGKPFDHKLDKDALSKKCIDISKIPLANLKSPEVKLNSSMLLFNPETMYSFLDNTGKKKEAPSIENARDIMTQCGMPFKFADNTIGFIDFRDCFVHVDTIMEGLSHPSTLHIWLKDDGRDIVIPFIIISEISKRKGSIIRVSYSLNKCNEHIYLETYATKSRPKYVNIAATINWLHKFLG